MTDLTSRGAHGFTLVEGLIVLAVVGIVAAAGGPEITRLMNKSQVEGAVKCSAILLRKARLEAVARNVTATVEMKVDGALRKLTGNAGTDLKAECTLPFQIETWSVTGFQNLDRPEKPGIVIFQGDGSAVETGAFQFDDRRGNSVRVEVSPAAIGRVRATKFEAGAWHARDEGRLPWLWL